MGEIFICMHAVCATWLLQDSLHPHCGEVDRKEGRHVKHAIS